MSRPCPVCGRPAVAGHRPFCSRRCAEVDLGRWLTGRYAIPAAPEAGEDARPGPGRDRQGRAGGGPAGGRGRRGGG